MTLYEKIKNWLKEKENKQKLIIAGSFIVVFIVGFGAGSYSKTIRRDAYKPQTNYTTKQPVKTSPETAAPQKSPAPVAATTNKAPTTNCIVKGNIGSGGKKIYHVKGGAFYDRTKAEECFNTEAEALAAGFTKSSR